MKVIYFHTGNWYGGVEKLLVDLFDYRAWSPDIEPVFVLCYKGLLSAQLEKRGAVVEFVSAPQPEKPWMFVRAWYQLWKILKKYGSKLIVSHEMEAHALAWPVERFFAIRSVLWIHSSSFRLNASVYKKLGKRMPHIAVCTSRHVETEVNQLWPDLKTEHLYHPYAKPQIGTNKTISPKKEVMLVYVGRLVEYKGLADAIEALGLLSELPFRLVVVGGSQMESEKKYKEKNCRRAEVLGIGDKVEFVGFKENVLDYLCSADVFVHPNKLPEPLGLVFMEALFTETPIVATDIGGAKEIFGLQPLKMGDLVPPNDVGALASILKKYIEEEDYRLQITKNIQEGFVNICDPAVSMKKLAHILSKCAN